LAFPHLPSYPDFLYGEGITGQEIIDVPAPTFLRPQMPPQSGIQPPPGRTHVEVPAWLERNLAQGPDV